MSSRREQKPDTHDTLPYWPTGEYVVVTGITISTIVFSYVLSFLLLVDLLVLSFVMQPALDLPPRVVSVFTFASFALAFGGMTVSYYKGSASMNYWWLVGVVLMLLSVGVYLLCTLNQF